ncbi:hypothetical protein [Actinomadura madurae]|uniref:hypothetical protein n=1 Tax=Actinomadura madurae TaxID=1993 RepID=UPI0020D2176D|nr:hypothetical protein [Actinomadura madurae]MCQ0021393.1 hypothetical protein [Actinomadura madurae]
MEALGEAAAEPGGLPRWRVVTGVVFLVLGLNALGFSAGATGPAANASLGGLVISLIIATAFLGPPAGPVRQPGPRAGRPDRRPGVRADGPARGRTAALRAGSLITPVALAVAFAGVQLFAQSTVAHAARVQAEEGLRADRVVVSSGPGLRTGSPRRCAASPA